MSELEVGGSAITPNINLGWWEAMSSLREQIEKRFPGPSREKSLAITKLDECELWLRDADRKS